MTERTVVMAGAFVGAIAGAFGGYLVFTERGRAMREQIEPRVDELRQEFQKFQRTIEKVGDMANEGMRVVQEFNTARSQAQFSNRTSH